MPGRVRWLTRRYHPPGRIRLMRSPASSPLRTATETVALPRVPAINGLRGLAIIGVVYFHVISGFWSAETLPPWWLSALLGNGWTGVNLFFLLSGFVLFLPYAADRQAMAELSGRLRFYRRRAMRLLPLFVVAVVVEWGLAARHGGTGLAELLAVLSFRFVVDPQFFFPSFNGPLWSIGAEVAFSALFPMLVLAGRRIGIGRLTVLVLAAALSLRLLGAMRNPAAGLAFNTDLFLCRIDEFALGMLAARLYVGGVLPRRPRVWLLGGTALIYLAWLGFDLTLRGAVPLWLRALLTDVLDAGFLALLLAVLAPRARAASVLSWRPLQVVGMMCYSIYIWHWPLLGWLMPDRATMPVGRFAGMLSVYLLLLLAIAALSYRFVEFGRVRAWRGLFLLGPAAKAGTRFAWPRGRRLAAPAAATADPGGDG